MKSKTIWFYFLICCLFQQKVSAQNQYFKFKVSKEGVYKITAAQAQQAGAQNLNQVAIFGYPGMLPQLLDSSNLVLQEIPGLEKNGNLYFFLTGPHQVFKNEKGQFEYSHHLFSDSLSFLIGTKTNPKRITSTQASTGNSGSATLYGWQSIKEEENNLLNSGRTWYSKPVNPGGLKGFSIRATSTISSSWKIAGTLMGKSLGTSEIGLKADDLEIFKSEITPIPNSTYGVKGREVPVAIDFKPTGNKLDRIVISYQSSDQNGAGYLDEISIGVPFSSQNLPEGIYLSDQSSSFSLSLNGQLSAWNISDFYEPKPLDLSNGNQITAEKLVVFNSAEVKSITGLTLVENQLRDKSSWPELLIIAPKILESAAENLRIHKISRGIYAEVAVLPEIYDAFGYGNPDLNAIRNLIAWHFHYGKKLKNVLILGKGTFDYKAKLGGRPNLVPIYTSRNSLNPLTTFSSDDYYGLIDWGQGEWEESREGDELMQIGVGRLPVINSQEALIVVDKIIQYETNPKPGDWKRSITLFADDADNNIHLRDSEVHANFLKTNHNEFLQNKLYLDRFEQLRSGSTQSSPEAKSALEKTLQEGTLLLNYIGHGNETTLTAEEVFLVSDIPNWANQELLALWMTATCEFGRHDSPFIRSAAEELLIAPNKGAIGLLTTGRPVFSSVNFLLNEVFIKEVFRTIEGKSQDLGSIFKNTKNGSLNGSLNRNFCLLGDPSMKLAAPEYKIRLTSLEDPKTKQTLDTLSAYQEVQFNAEVVDPETGNKIDGFNGTYEIELRDKPSTSKTLGDESSSAEFEEEKILLFRGSGQIVNGSLTGRMLIPKNINYSFGEGSIRILGVSNDIPWEAFGSEKPIIGGVGDNIPVDNTGPEIKAFFEGENSVPLIFAATSIKVESSLSDLSGINISGLGIGQELSIQVNDNEPVILNEKFRALNGSYQEGSFSIQLSGLREGKNLITIRAWDNLGNGSVFSQEIIVEGSDRLQILNHKTYPNPAESESNFEFEHNRPGENLLAEVSVYNLNGQILFSESFRFVKAEAVISDLSWFFFQSQTKYPAKGTYIYKLTLQSETDNSVATSSGKIVIK
ncbi:MAG: type IX secretion system sortase PorU [Algoriphagus sp.]|nr:type IX secretion system sortase PorU [Algoriphagus sp.]